MVPASCTTEPRLPRFYAGREVLVTGATGFMGKVLLARLLATCPDVSRLHLLIQPKLGASPHERLHLLKQSPVFDEVRECSPRQLDKLVVVAGDIRAELLGLDASVIAKLNQVSVMFHTAASTKFWEPLQKVVDQNVSSAINVMDLCDKLPALQALVHVSTAYSNAELRHVKERVYEPPMELARLQELLSTIDSPQTLMRLTPILIKPKFNTYMFTKALAETAVAQRERRHYSAAIFRPSIIVSSHRAPFPGWVEGLSGAIGVLVTMAQGVLRVFSFEGDKRADLVPVDVAVDSMLAVAWETATDKSAEARVYYCGSQENPLLWRQFYAEMEHNARACPMHGVLYYPFFLNVHNRYLHKALQVMLQTAPLYGMEFFSRLMGRKPRMSYTIIAKRLNEMTKVLRDFSCGDFSFSVDNMRRLREKLVGTDSHLFYLDIKDINWQEHMANFHRGAKKYILRQKDEDLPHSLASMNRLRVVHYVVKLVLMLLGFISLNSMFVRLVQKIKSTQKNNISLSKAYYLLFYLFNYFEN